MHHINVAYHTRTHIYRPIAPLPPSLLLYPGGYIIDRYGVQPPSPPLPLLLSPPPLPLTPLSLLFPSSSPSPHTQVGILSIGTGFSGVFGSFGTASVLRAWPQSYLTMQKVMRVDIRTYAKLSE